jgi:hypothetical protein
VVACIPAAHYIMLSKPLLYTAMSRAQKLLILVGDKKGLMLSLRKNAAPARNSLLSERLHRAVTMPSSASASDSGHRFDPFESLKALYASLELDGALASLWKQSVDEKS